MNAWSTRHQANKFDLVFADPPFNDISYRDLDVWKRSLILVTDVYLITRKLPPDERFGLTSQLRRAAALARWVKPRQRRCNVSGLPYNRNRYDKPS